MDHYVDEAGMPIHFPMLVTETGSGPCDDGDVMAHHYTCWCGTNCMWQEAFDDQWHRAYWEGIAMVQ